MDQAVHIWNVWNTKQPKARIFNYHKAAVKDVRWTPNGLSLLSCGFDCSSRVVDVEKGEETNIFKEDQVVEVIKFHPNDPNLFLSGGSKGFLRLWDIRMGKMVKEYQRSLGAILDIEFSADGKHFISSSDTSKSNISENCIIIWDVVRQVPLSNQVNFKCSLSRLFRFCFKFLVIEAASSMKLQNINVHYIYAGKIYLRSLGQNTTLSINNRKKCKNGSNACSNEYISCHIPLRQ